MTKTKEEYYIASAECYEVKYFDGTIATKDGQIVRMMQKPNYDPNEQIDLNKDITMQAVMYIVDRDNDGLFLRLA